MFRLLWLLAITSSVLCGQEVHTTDVATRALGGTGLAREGGSAVWTNPAGLAFTTRFTGRATVEQRFGLKELQTASLAGAVRRGFGLRLTHYGYGGYLSTRVDGLYGRLLTDRLAVGLALGVHGLRLPQQTGRGELRTSIGVQYRIGRQLRAGAVWQLDRTDGRGASFGGGLNYLPSTLLDLSAEVHYAAATGLTGRFGVDYTPVNEIALRLGLDTAVNELSGGVGYRLFSRWEVAVAVAYHQQLGVSSVAGLIWHPE